MPKTDENLLECACGSRTWYTRDEFTVTVDMARNAGERRPIHQTVEPVTRCTSCEQTMQDAVAQL